MKKLKFLSAAMAAVVLATSIALPASASTSAASLTPVKTAPITDSTLTAGKFNIIEDTFQYGIDVTRLIVNLGTEVPYNAVDSDTFTVKAKTFTSDTKQQVFPDLDSKDDFYNTTAYDAANPDGIRYTVGVYVCDKDGNQLKKGTGSYAMINLAHGMYQNGASDNHRNNGCPAAIYEGLYCHSLVLNYSISQNKPIKGIDSTLTFTQNATINPEADCWDAGTTADLRYRAYAPTNDGKKHPLIIWLHGAGEGGPEEGMQIKANWVTSFSDASNQAIFGNAYVLAPECPQIWVMSDYVSKVQSVIDTYIANNANIDTNRIYIGGLSAGGYMAWKMLLHKPEMYAGAVIASAAYCPTVDECKLVKNKPIWLVYAEDDPYCVPSKFSGVATQQFKSVGAINYHYSDYNNVITDGTRYFGHCAWNYVYDNTATDDSETTNLNVLNWLASQAKGSITLDTRSYTMAPKNSYDVGVKVANISDKTVKAYSSNSGAAKLTKLANGNYRITGVAAGTSYITFEVQDKNGNLLTHASIKVTVTNGAKQHGDATKATSIF